ncbi:glycosyltransferase family 61 protein [Bremerella sp. JC770]|uniref:glycosyltransferase family 61 protein n=1 Tax=Bremerella sp. JC770 TaxID=3232137 RepID=UPI00345A82F7
MKSLTRARNQLRRKIRTAWNRGVGTPPPADFDDARTWLASNRSSGSAKVLEPAERIVGPARINGGRLDEVETLLQRFPDSRQSAIRHYIDGPVERTLAEASLTTLKDARVALRGVAVITNDNRHLLDFGLIRFPGLSDEGAIPQYVHEGYLPRQQKVSGTLGVISHGWSSSNYYHFLVEAIPKLRLFAKAGVSYDKLYAPMSRPYHREIYELFGVDTRQIIPESYHAHVQADVVCVPNHRYPVRREETQFLYETAAQQPWAKVSQEPRKLVYVSRKRMKLRNCLNESEFMPKLEKLGFECHCLEKMNVREQIELFQQADVIMGPHGAGLGNMVFAPPGTKVIELGTPYRPYDCFGELAAACGHPFYWHVAKSVDGDLVTEESNMWVDTDNLIEFLHQHEIVSSSANMRSCQRESPRCQIAGMVGSV